MKKFVSVLLSLFLLLTMVPLGAVSVGAATYEGYVAPNISSKYYTTSANPYYPQYKGQCTAFVYGRCYEKLGIKLKAKTYTGTGSDGLTKGKTYTSFRNNAVTWWHINKALNIYPYGSTPKANSIVVWSGYETGHVGFVENVVDQTVYYTEANFSNFVDSDAGGGWDGKLHKTTSAGMKKISGLTLLGYIYVGGDSTPTLTIKYHANGGSIASEITGSTYKVTDPSGLNMRKDAGVNKTWLTALPKGATFTVKTGDTKTADNFTWGKTTYGGHTGWVVISDFVEKIGSSASGEFYLSSSLVYVSAKGTAETTVWKLGSGNGDGLRNAATFGLTRNGYNFVGWCTKADGSATIFDQHDGTIKAEDIYPDLKNGSATVTLYAIWEKAACNHVPVATEEGYEATCTEEGLTDGVECSLCGEVLAQQEVIPMLDHETVLINGYEATCTEDGLTDGEECGICGEVLIEQEILPALDHTIIILEGYEPTCTEEGLTDGEECSVCGEILTEQEILDVLDHKVVIIEGYDATCTEDGLTEGEMCAVCGEILVEQEIIYAYDHEIEYLEGYEPTCTEDGLSEGEVCAVCGEVLVEQEVIPATGHEADIIYGYEATCTEEGLTDGEECYWCGEILVEQEVIPMIPHEPYTVEGYEATCTEEGLTEGEECYWCGEILVEQQIIQMIPHEPYTVEGYEATCTEDGLTNGEECYWCGEILVEQEIIPALDHEVVIVKGYEATCTEDGLSDGKECAFCGEILVEQEYLYALGHAYSDHYDATCNECGEVREVPNDPNKPDVPVIPDPPAPDLPTDAPAFVVDSVTAREGEEFTVAIRTQHNSGIVSLKLKVGYDTTMLELVSVTEQDFTGMSFGSFTNNPFIINWVDAIHPDNTTDGVVALVTFRVKEGAKGTAAITLTYDAEDVYDQNYDNVAFRIENGTVTVVEYTPGDVNNDGKINNKDLGMLQQYVNEWEISLTEAAADCNSDGRINNKDLGLLQQYVNEWDVTLG